MKKKWKVFPQITKQEQEKYPDINPVILQLLFNRGLVEKQAIDSFFNTTAELLDPFLFQNMQSACDLIIQKLKQKETIALVGDYDADGVTSLAVLQQALTFLGGKVKIWIPSRMGDGYGLNTRIIDEIITEQCSLIITVDNGIKSKTEVKYAQEKGLDIIITDHHLLTREEDLPQTIIINPILEQEKYPFKYLAGVGVAFKLASALISLAKLDTKTKEKLLNKIIDLVAIGTIADCVSLLGENRQLVQKGLQELNNHPRIGLVKLAQLSNFQFPIKEWNVSWQIAPRLNATGRLGAANTAYELLITQKESEAQRLAEQLNQNNIDRQKITKKITEYCQKKIEAEMQNEKILIMLSPDLEKEGQEEFWPEGVVGLVAGRLTDYGKPALVICSSQGQIKGSARSVGDFDLVQALSEVEQYLVRYGGHKMAAGFTIKSGELSNFITAMKKIAEEKIKVEAEAEIEIDAQLTITDLTSELLNQISLFAPFGQNNPEPIFSTNNIIIDNVRMMGADNQHLKLSFANLEAIAFNIPENWSNLQPGDKINIAYNLTWNEFNGYRKIQLKIIDLQIEK